MTNQGLRSSKTPFLKRLTAALIGLLFLGQEIFSGAALAAPRPQSVDLKLPAVLGRVETFHQGSTDKTILFVQDAHDSLEAQLNISGIIRYAVTRHGVQTVFEEGYEGPVPTDEVYRTLKDPKTREAVSYYLLDQLRIGGAEFAHINRFPTSAARESSRGAKKDAVVSSPRVSGGDPSFGSQIKDVRGVEKQGDFKLIGADSLQGHLENIRWFQNAVRKKNPALQDIDLLILEFQRLADSRFPKTLKDYLKLKQRFDDEQMDLLEYLTRARPLAPKEKSYASVDLLLQAEQLRRRADRERIEKIAVQALFAEIQRLNSDISAELLKSTLETEPRAFEIYAALQHLIRLKRLLDFEMTPAELEAAKQDLLEFDTQAMARLLVKETRRSAVFSKTWETAVRSAIEFYDSALKRETAIDSALSLFLRQPDEKTAVLVYGGFHRQGIESLLTRSGVSYYVISPAISQRDVHHQRLYRKLMETGYELNPMQKTNRPPRETAEAVPVDINQQSSLNAPPQAARLISELEKVKLGGPLAGKQLQAYQYELSQAASLVLKQDHTRHAPLEYISALIDRRLSVRSEVRAEQKAHEPILQRLRAKLGETFEVDIKREALGERIDLELFQFLEDFVGQSGIHAGYLRKVIFSQWAKHEKPERLLELAPSLANEPDIRVGGFYDDPRGDVYVNTAQWHEGPLWLPLVHEVGHGVLNQFASKYHFSAPEKEYMVDHLVFRILQKMDVQKAEVYKREYIDVQGAFRYRFDLSEVKKQELNRLVDAVVLTIQLQPARFSVGYLPELLRTENDGPFMALRDKEPKERTGKYFKKGDFLVYYDPESFSKNGNRGVVAAKAILRGIDMERESMTIELVNDQGESEGRLQNLPIQSDRVWKWDDRRAPFLPPGVAGVQSWELVSNLRLPLQIVQTLDEAGLWRSGDLERAKKLNLLKNIPGLTAEDLELIGGALSKYTAGRRSEVRQPENRKKKKRKSRELDFESDQELGDSEVRMIAGLTEQGIFERKTSEPGAKTLTIPQSMREAALQKNPRLANTAEWDKKLGAIQAALGVTETEMLEFFKTYPFIITYTPAVLKRKWTIIKTLVPVQNKNVRWEGLRALAALNTDALEMIIQEAQSQKRLIDSPNHLRRLYEKVDLAVRRKYRMSAAGYLSSEKKLRRGYIPEAPQRSAQKAAPSEILPLVKQVVSEIEKRSEVRNQESPLVSDWQKTQALVSIFEPIVRSAWEEKHFLRSSARGKDLKELGFSLRNSLPSQPSGNAERDYEILARTRVAINQAREAVYLIYKVRAPALDADLADFDAMVSKIQSSRVMKRLRSSRAPEPDLAVTLENIVPRLMDVHHAVGNEKLILLGNIVALGEAAIPVLQEQLYRDAKHTGHVFLEAQAVAAVAIAAIGGKEAQRLRQQIGNTVRFILSLEEKENHDRLLGALMWAMRRLEAQPPRVLNLREPLRFLRSEMRGTGQDIRDSALMLARSEYIKTGASRSRQFQFPIADEHGDIVKQVEYVTKSGLTGKWPIVVLNFDSHHDFYSGSNASATWARKLAHEGLTYTLTVLPVLAAGNLGGFGSETWMPPRALNEAKEYRTIDEAGRFRYPELKDAQVTITTWENAELHINNYRLQDYPGQIWISIDYDFFSVNAGLNHPGHHIATEKLRGQFETFAEYLKRNNIRVDEILGYRSHTSAESYLNRGREEKWTAVMDQQLYDLRRHFFYPVGKIQRKKLGLDTQPAKKARSEVRGSFKKELTSAAREILERDRQEELEAAWLNADFTRSEMRTARAGEQTSTSRLIDQALKRLAELKTSRGQRNQIVETIEFLSGLGVEDAVDDIAFYVDPDPNKEATLEAIQGLGRIGGSKALNHLARAAEFFIDVKTSVEEKMRRDPDTAKQAALHGILENFSQIIETCIKSLQKADEIEGTRKALELYGNARTSPSASKDIYHALEITPRNISLFQALLDENIQRGEPNVYLFYEKISQYGNQDLIPWLLQHERKLSSKDDLLGILATLTSFALAAVGEPSARRAFKQELEAHGVSSLLSTSSLFHLVWERIINEEPEYKDHVRALLRKEYESVVEDEQKLRIALVLVRLEDAVSAEYLTERWLTTNNESLKKEIQEALFFSSDSKTLPFWLAIYKQAEKGSPEKKIAMLRLSQIDSPETVSVLSSLLQDKEPGTRQVAYSLLYEKQARMYKVPEKRGSQVDSDIPGAVWTPVKIHEEDSGRSEAIEELVEKGLLLTREEAVRRMPFWEEELKKLGLIEQTIYFSPVRDPSYVLLPEQLEEENKVLETSRRALVFNRKTSSYVVKYSGAQYPHIFESGRLAIPFFYDPNHWFYGGDDPLGDSFFDREMTNSLGLQERLQEVFETDAVFKKAKQGFGVSEQAFLHPMVRVEPLMIPIAILAEDRVVYQPLSQALPLMGVTEADRKNFKMQFYIYKNPSGSDIRMSSLIFLELTHKAWQPYLKAFGISVTENNPMRYKDKDITEIQAKELVTLNAFRRYALFIRLLHDHLKMSGHVEDRSDIFTFQNLSPLTVFDYQNFSSENYTDANLRDSVSGAMEILDDLTNKWGLSSKRVRQIRGIFRGILTEGGGVSQNLAVGLSNEARSEVRGSFKKELTAQARQTLEQEVPGVTLSVNDKHEDAPDDPDRVEVQGPKIQVWKAVQTIRRYYGDYAVTTLMDEDGALRVVLENSIGYSKRRYPKTKHISAFDKEKDSRDGASRSEVRSKGPLLLHPEAEVEEVKEMLRDIRTYYRGKGAVVKIAAHKDQALQYLSLSKLKQHQDRLLGLLGLWIAEETSKRQGPGGIYLFSELFSGIGAESDDGRTLLALGEHLNLWDAFPGGKDRPTVLRTYHQPLLSRFNWTQLDPFALVRPEAGYLSPSYLRMMASEHLKRSEVRMISNYQLREVFGEERTGPTLLGGRNEDFLYENGQKIAVRMPWAKFVYRALDQDGNEIPDRVYKITHYMSDNDTLFEEAKALFKLQQEPAVEDVPKLVRAGMMKSGGMWIEQQGLSHARSLEREVFGRPPRLFETLIRAGEIVQGVHSRGLVHADLKPGQFLINDAQELQLIDFGNVREIGSGETRDNYTPGYVPLNLEGKPIVSELAEDTDVYSFVIMIAELIDQQTQLDQPPETAELLRRTRDSYLNLVFEKWSFEHVQELFFPSAQTTIIKPRAREEWPKSMPMILRKLEEDLEAVRKTAGRSEMRATVKKDMSEQTESVLPSAEELMERIKETVLSDEPGQGLGVSIRNQYFNPQDPDVVLPARVLAGDILQTLREKSYSFEWLQQQTERRFAEANIDFSDSQPFYLFSKPVSRMIHEQILQPFLEGAGSSDPTAIRSEVRASKLAEAAAVSAPPILRQAAHKVEDLSVSAAVFLDAREFSLVPEEQSVRQMDELMALLSRHPHFDLYVEGSQEDIRQPGFLKLVEQYRARVHFGPPQSRASLQKKEIFVRVSFFEIHQTRHETLRSLEKLREDYGVTQEMTPLEYTRAGALKGFLDLAESLKAEEIRDLPARYAVKTASGYLRMTEDYLASIWSDLQKTYVFQWSA